MFILCSALFLSQSAVASEKEIGGSFLSRLVNGFIEKSVNENRLRKAVLQGNSRQVSEFLEKVNPDTVRCRAKKNFDKIKFFNVKPPYCVSSISVPLATVAALKCVGNPEEKARLSILQQILAKSKKWPTQKLRITLKNTEKYKKLPDTNIKFYQKEKVSGDTVLELLTKKQSFHEKHRPNIEPVRRVLQEKYDREFKKTDALL